MSASPSPEVPIFGCPHGNVITTCHSCWACSHGNVHSTCVECHPDRREADPNAISQPMPAQQKMAPAPAAAAHAQPICPHGELAALCERCKGS